MELGDAGDTDGRRAQSTFVRNLFVILLVGVLGVCLLFCCAGLALRLIDHEYWN